MRLKQKTRMIRDLTQENGQNADSVGIIMQVANPLPMGKTAANEDKKTTSSISADQLPHK